MAITENSVQIPQTIQDKFTILLIYPITDYIAKLNDTGMSQKTTYMD